MPTRSDLTFVQGDDPQLGLLVLGPGGTVDLTGKRIEIRVKPSEASSDAEAVLVLSSVTGGPPRIAITAPLVGEAVADLSNLVATPGTWWYQAWTADVTDPDLDRETFSFGLWSVGTGGEGVAEGPCVPWPVNWCEDVSAYTADQIAVATHAAQDVLWALSGRRYGECDITVRPCKAPAAYGGGPDGHGWRPMLYAGHWINVCGHFGPGCACVEVQEVRLYPTPVSQIVAVKVDGSVLSPNAYRLDEAQRLVRIDGGAWPACQRIDLPDTAEGTFSVEFTYGLAVPALAQMALGEMAAEFLRACTGGQCSLPKRVRDVVVQGTSVTMLDPQDFLTDGLTGFYFADLWLSSVNPSRLKQRPRVYSPDLPRPRVVAS